MKRAAGILLRNLIYGMQSCAAGEPQKQQSVFAFATLKLGRTRFVLDVSVTPAALSTLRGSRRRLKGGFERVQSCGRWPVQRRLFKPINEGP